MSRRRRWRRAPLDPPALERLVLAQWREDELRQTGRDSTAAAKEVHLAQIEVKRLLDHDALRRGWAWLIAGSQP